MYTTVLTEADLLLRHRFETRTLENAAFRHREHVRLTWVYLQAEPPPAVEARLCRMLLELATSHGVAGRFHHTLTVAWVRIIEAARRSHPDTSFDALVEACPSLLDKDAPLGTIATIKAMAAGTAMIMSNSSFSWWAATLMRSRHPGALVVAPRPWTGAGDSRADLLEPDWITLDAR